MKWIISRLQEPSTHAALAAGSSVLLALFPQYQGIFAALGGLFVSVGVVAKEAKSSGLVK